LTQVGANHVANPNKLGYFLTRLVFLDFLALADFFLVAFFLATRLVDFLVGFFFAADFFLPTLRLALVALAFLLLFFFLATIKYSSLIKKWIVY
jgi:hypothetical protein